ncbi:MAG TPA: hypothetical protein VGH38_16915 [Bryobacteraceae bacterium]
MAAGDYVQQYLQLWCWVNDTFTMAQIRNYLQSGMGAQSTHAAHEYSRLMSALPRLAGQPGRPLPAVFQVQGDQYVRTSLWRVYHGKGAPNEIQDALWLASLCGLVDESNLLPYTNNNLGIDCGGFVANYWGMGRPSVTDPSPNGATGFKPRSIWGMYPSLHRRTPQTIQPDDAAIFFKDVRSDDPNLAAHQNADGTYDTSSGSQAFHIGVVSSATVLAGGNQVNLEIAESSGALASSGGNGVNVRAIRNAAVVVARNLVYCREGTNRIYFTGRPGPPAPYMQNPYGA